MHACSTDDICAHATRMLYTITMEMKLFLVPLFYSPWFMEIHYAFGHGGVVLHIRFREVFFILSAVLLNIEIDLQDKKAAICGDIVVS